MPRSSGRQSRCAGTWAPDFFGSAYEECLAWELEARGLTIRRQVAIPVVYKGVPLAVSYRVGVLIGETLVVEVKSVEQLTSVHDAEVLTYMKISGAAVGLLLNFNTPVLRDGIRRFSAPTARKAASGGGSETAAEAERRHRGTETLRTAC